MANKKKLATSVAAVATAAAVLLGGTFAWQSISQTALNESADVVNPGGRLHNDMWYVSETENNNDIYVENFGEEPIVARVRLSEYMEVVLNRGTAGELEKWLIGSKTEQTDDEGNVSYTYDYKTFTGYDELDGNGAVNAGYALDENGDRTDDPAYWTWQTGGSTVYMPTFNMNKDSLAADLNGVYRDAVGGISNREAEQYLDENGDAIDAETYGYIEDEPLEADAVYDYDRNTFDEFSDGTEELNVTYKVISETHTAKYTANAELMAMSEWLEMVWDEDLGEYAYDADAHGNYWVYDDSAEGNGWVYWSAYIGAKSATGLLLNGITLNQVMDDSWYYAIEAEGQFCTPDDTGVMPTGYSLDEEESTEGTGFYANGETVSDQAITFLSIIGVTDDTPGYEDDDYEDEEASYSFYLLAAEVGEDGDAEGYGGADHFSMNTTYSLCAYVAEDDLNPADHEDPDYTVDFNLELDSGDDWIEGEDYTLTVFDTQFKGVTVTDEEGNERTEYVACAELKILNDDHIGDFLTVEMSTPNGEGDSLYAVIQEHIIYLDVQLFDSDGDAELTDYVVKSNHTYDVRVSAYIEEFGELVIFDSRENVQAAENISQFTINMLNLSSSEDLSISERGQIMTGENPGDQEDFHVDATIKDLKVFGENEEILWRGYASGTTEWLYSEGAAKLEFYDEDEDNTITINENEGKSVGIPLTVGLSTAWDVKGIEFTVSDATDDSTRVEPYTDEWGEDCYILYLGEKETSTQITIVASKEGYADSDRFTVNIISTPLVVYYAEPGDIVYEKDGSYYTMYLKASLDGEALTSEKNLGGVVYYQDGEDELYSGTENIDFAYDESMGCFYFKIDMERCSLYPGSVYDLCVTYNDGTNTYTSNRLSYTYPTTIMLTKDESTKVGYPNAVIEFNRGSDDGKYVITSNNPDVVSYTWDNTYDWLTEDDGTWTLEIRGGVGETVPYDLNACDEEENVLATVTLSITGGSNSGMM